MAKKIIKPELQYRDTVKILDPNTTKGTATCKYIPGMHKSSAMVIGRYENVISTQNPIFNPDLIGRYVVDVFDAKLLPSAMRTDKGVAQPTWYVLPESTRVESKSYVVLNKAA